MYCLKCKAELESDELERVVEYEEMWGRPTVIADFYCCPFCGGEEMTEDEEDIIEEEEEVDKRKII